MESRKRALVRSRTPTADGRPTKQLRTSDSTRSTGSPPPQEQTPHKVKVTADGLLDVTNIPQHLVDVTQRNKIESPLLRLPGELRIRIWEYAFSGMTINIRYHPRTKFYGNRRLSIRSKREDESYSAYKPIEQDFGLRRACRVIYAETACLPYALNTIVFEEYVGTYSYYGLFQNRFEPIMIYWGKSAIPYQTKSVKRVKSALPISRIIPNMDDYHYCSFKTPIKQFFPSLRTLHISAKWATTMARRYPSPADPNIIPDLEREIKERNGMDIEVFFIEDRE